MPSVIDTPELELEDVATHDLTIETLERPQPRETHPGFWRMLAHKLTQYLTPTPREQHAPLYRVHRPFEAPIDRFVREYPYLSVYALAVI